MDINAMPNTVINQSCRRNNTEINSNDFCIVIK